jgi:hypothetical protein
MDKDFAPFAQLARPFGFASGPSLAESKLLSCHKTADPHFQRCCLRPDISERNQKHFLERVPESKRETNDAAAEITMRLAVCDHRARQGGFDGSASAKLTGPIPQIAMTAGSFWPRITPS